MNLDLKYPSYQWDWLIAPSEILFDKELMFEANMGRTNLSSLEFALNSI